MPNHPNDVQAPAAVVPGSRADREGLDGLEFVTGVTPSGSVSERLEDDEADDVEAPAPMGWPDDPIPDVDDDGTSGDPEITIPDVDDQGRSGEPDQDWQGQPETESERRLPGRTRG